MLYDAYFLRNWKFSKKMIFLFFAKNPTQPFSQKVSVAEHWDQVFWIPRIILHQKHPLLTEKTFFFNLFNTKMIILRI